MPKPVEFIISALFAAAITPMLNNAEWWTPIVLAAGSYGTWIICKWIWKKVVVKPKKQDPESQAPVGAVLRGVRVWGNAGDGIRITKGTTVDMDDVESHDNGGQGINIG